MAPGQKIGKRDCMHSIMRRQRRSHTGLAVSDHRGLRLQIGAALARAFNGLVALASNTSPTVRLYYLLRPSSATKSSALQPCGVD
ncbi:MAG: hypothetical protein OXC93_04005 [Rhodospirillaceae bacterium]|nr:hypothetical protein [Rhodospirillaceae bacterium]